MKKFIKAYWPKIIGFRLNLLFNRSPQKAVKKSFKLFAGPREGRVKRHQKTFLDKAKSEKLTVKNLKIQTYVWPNKGESVLLIHGWESNSSRWAELVSELQNRNYTVLSLDAPAHGYSEGNLFDVPVYAEAVAQLIAKHKPHYAIGHSVGASTLIFQHYVYPNKVLKKMVLLAPPAKMSNLMSGFQKQLGLKAELMRALEEFFIEKFGYSFQEFSMLNFSRDFELKALFVHDKDDKIVQWKESAALVGAWENARLFITKGTGHGLRSEEIDSVILDFLKAE